MRAADVPADLFSMWESAVAFRLFADQTEPTLSIPEQIAAPDHPFSFSKLVT